MVAANNREGVACPDCGDTRPVAAAVKPYARATGQWIIGGAVLTAAGWSSFTGLTAQIVGGVGGVFLAIAVFRVLRQVYLLKSLGPQ